MSELQQDSSFGNKKLFNGMLLSSLDKEMEKKG